MGAVRRTCRASVCAVDRYMAKGERGGQGSRTVPVTIEEPVLVPMSDAERAAAVSVLAETPDSLVDTVRHRREDRPWPDSGAGMIEHPQVSRSGRWVWVRWLRDRVRWLLVLHQRGG